ncbi:type IV secretion protein Rhs [Acinetobacter zhairhuonensis]|uniref:type IV secretion protein Rhs n=1 Tax=Acinetobacter sp. A7.4 TaxID=2919921 RepID=UPI001F4F7D7C|nr:type IV secretion protein Rhs [Acinetobacter sp. A7.4]MCJ8162965.1 type IV secretion protein Rhs [Acinetobacter sp. A7.4]
MAYYFSRLIKSIKRFGIIAQRPLTDGEKILVRSIFADTIQLDQVQIVAHKAILKNYAMSPNGHIYFHQQNYCQDFSKCSLGLQSWFMHEMTHVWQYQQGIAVVRKALFDRRYAYVLVKGKLFLHYGIEQQAQMVQDYFMKKAQGQDCDAYEKCIPFLAPKA